MPALLGIAYRANSEPVPDSYYWLFIFSSTRAAQPPFYKLLKPEQTERVLGRAIRSGRQEDFREAAWSIPDALPHVLNLLCTADSLASLRGLWSFEKFGPSYAALGHLIDVAGRILVQLGHDPLSAAMRNSP